MSDSGDNERRVIRVPDPEVVDAGDDEPEMLVGPAEIGSASRSCLAIIIMLIIIVLMICIFLILQPFVR
ncbi:MAG TPA: hypothetical protein VNZ58_05365 [Thermomicrobiales bacterium]|nr:hypothetical protein [Thermomicrobiales bacterium]